MLNLPFLWNRKEPYRYKKIEATSQIRLFRFRKTKGKRVLSIKLETACVENLPPYECLSYTWGDLNVRKTILCDGRELSITENLWNALQRIRITVGGERLFWADQISINQNNEGEKSAQVGMMIKIFSNTARVICWLGEENEHTATAFELLSEWARSATDENLKLRLSRLWSSDTGPNTEEQRNNEAAVASFFSRQWFRRTWILQEMCMSSQLAIMVCGSHEIAWRQIFWAFFIIAKTLSHDDTLKALGENIEYVLVMFDIFFERGKHLLPLSRLIKHTARREVTDPRDRYFALLGIMEQEGYTYPPADYSLTTEQVYLRYTRAMIDQDQTLCALSPGRLKCPNDNFPTWVLTPEKVENSCAPLWREFRMLEAWSHGATGATKPLVLRASSPFDEELQLFGWTIDRIERLYEWESFAQMVDHPQNRWSDVLNMAKSFVRDLGLDPVYRQTGESIVAAFMRTVVADKFLVGCQKFATHQTPPWRLYDAFLRCDEDGTLTKSPAGDAAGGEPERLSNCGWTEESLCELATSTFLFAEPELDNDGDVQTDQSVTASAGTSNVVKWLDTFLPARLAAEMNAHRHGSRLAVTANKSLALVPGAARVNDDLCLLLGGFLPFVLREAGECGRYRLMGEAYVHGYLDGESGRKCEQLYDAAIHQEDYSGLTKFRLI